MIIMKCTRCNGSGNEPEEAYITDWIPASLKPVHIGIYQKNVDGYIRYAFFNGNEWCGWCESIKTAMYPSYQKYEHPDNVNPWRGMKSPSL